MTQPLLIIAAGGSGGHMFPAQSLAEEMLSRGWQVKLSTDARGARFAGNFPKAVTIEQVPAATFARGGLLAKAIAPFRIVAGILRATLQMRSDRPAAVAGFGGYPALPAMAAAWLTLTPRLIHEQNGVLGRVNQLFARRVDAVACGTWPTTLPVGITGVHVGNPVRGVVRDHAGAPYVPPGSGTLNLLAFGGSQGASIIAKTVPAALSQLPEDMRARLNVTCQARPADHDATVQAFQDAGIRAEVSEFIFDLPERMAASQLVISRSGASSIADISVIGRPSILIPLAAAIRDEQSANAQGLASIKAAVVLKEDVFNPTSLAEAVSAILESPERASDMARAALSLSKPEAAKALADLVQSIAKDAS